jgi:hypothetical protein
MTAPDFAVMVRLLAETTPEKPRTWLSRKTIADQTGLAERSVSTAIETLVAEHWIKKTSGKRAYNQNLYEVLYANLPTEQKPTPKISSEAEALATWYQQIFLQEHMTYANRKGRRCRRKLRRDWKQRWSYVIQTFLDDGNSPDYITRVFNWASANRPKAFVAGPQALRAIWPKEVTK